MTQDDSAGPDEPTNPPQQTSTPNQPALVTTPYRSKSILMIGLEVLLISGGQSDVVSDTTISEFLTLVPHAEHERIAHATHMVVGDDNHAFTRSVSRFIPHRLATPAARH